MSLVSVLAYLGPLCLACSTAAAYQTTVDWHDVDPGTRIGRSWSEGRAAVRDPVVRKVANGQHLLALDYEVHAPSGPVYQAEDAVLSGVTVYADPRAQGSKAVGEFGDRSGDFIEFRDLSRSDRLNVYYNNGTSGAKQCGLYVNGQRVATLAFNDTGGWFSPFQVVTYQGAVEGTVRLQVDQEDFKVNKTFCCNVDAINLGEPLVASTVGLAIPCSAPAGTNVFSIRMTIPEGLVVFAVEDQEGVLHKSIQFHRHESDPKWGRFTVLLNDLDPPIPAATAATGFEAVQICVTTQKAADDSLLVEEVVFAKGWPSTPPADCPLETSPSFAGLEFTGRHASYTRADTWYPSWASDGKLYSPYTDGFVSETFVHSDNADATTGMGLIEGEDPLHLTVTDIGSYRSRPWPYATRYPCGTLVHNGVWYYGTYILNGDGRPNGNYTFLGPFVGFRHSTDFGKTWTETPCTPLNNLFGETVDRYAADADTEIKRYTKIKMGSPHFVDFGKNMEHAPDGKAYLTAHGNTDPLSPQSWILGDQIYLARVTPTPANINDVTKYDFFAGRDRNGKALWVRDFEDIKPVFEWKGHTGCVTATYNAPLGKYFMCVSTGREVFSTFDTYLLEADSLEGPWRMIAYMEAFGRQAYFVNIPSKFISGDGMTMWLCYAANWTGHSSSPQGSSYAMSLHEFRLVPRT
jgi:hypothetical protein